MFVAEAYKDYVREFTWDDRKFPKKRSLNELTISIQKQMLQKDEQIRKNMDEYTNMKQRIAALTKKDTGSLLVRDFADDIYTKRVSSDLFVEAMNSESFVNLLMVIHSDKFAAFEQNLPEMMTKYYEMVDIAENKRIREQAKNKFNEILLNHRKWEHCNRKFPSAGLDKANWARVCCRNA